MEIAEFVTYAEEAHGIREERKWDGFPGFSVLADPRTGKWVALLMRQWDGERGEEIQRADIKCGRDVLEKLVNHERGLSPFMANAACGTHAQSTPLHEVDREALPRAFGQAPAPDSLPAIAALGAFGAPCLSAPFRMKGANWVGVSFGDEADSEIVCMLLDRAVGRGSKLAVDTVGGAWVYGDTPLPFAKADASACPPATRSGGRAPEARFATSGSFPAGAASGRPATRSAGRSEDAPAEVEPPVAQRARVAVPQPEGSCFIRETPPTIPQPEGSQGQLAFDIADGHAELPERIRQMIALYEYGDGSPLHRARNFYRQGAFMADYVDDAPWQGSFRHYFTTYHDLNVVQLRGYFTWRSRVRAGDFRPIATSLAYIYVYELLNGIGAGSPEDALAKMEQFQAGFVDSGIGGAGMQGNLRRWMFEFAVVHGLPLEIALRYFDDELRGRDRALAALKAPARHADGEVFAALCSFAGKQLAQTPVVETRGDAGRRLFAEAWRNLCAGFGEGGGGIFEACFGRMRDYRWHPLGNAVVYERPGLPDADYVLDACRSYHRRGGSWRMESYEQLYFDLGRLRAFAHEADRLFRRELKTGRYLRPKPAEAWVTPYAEAALATVRHEEREAARPKVRIDFSNLERIRADAAITRDSLLVEEEAAAPVADGAVLVPAAAPGAEPGAAPGVAAPADDLVRTSCEPNFATRPFVDEWAPVSQVVYTNLDDAHVHILSRLLAGGDAQGLMREQHLMPTLVADTINEALFDLVGDNVLDCDGATIELVEDYREDVAALVEGSE